MITTRTPPLGHAVAHFGRLVLTSRDYATAEAACECGDDESYFLPDPAQRRELLLRHGHDAFDLVAHWRHEKYQGRCERDEQDEAYVEMMSEHFSMGRYR